MVKNRRRLESEKFGVPLWYRIAVYFATWIMALVMRFIFVTSKIVVFGEEDEEVVRREWGTCGYAAWHRGLPYNIYHFRRRRGKTYNPVIMASRSRDGEWAAGLLKRFGYSVPRGSSSRHGKEALAEYVQLLNDGFDCGLANDAPRGPAQRAKMGSVIAACRSGRPLIIYVMSASRCWRLGTWDKTLIPKPFSRIVVLFDREPIMVPADATRDELEGYRQLVENRLNVLTYQADVAALDPKRYNDPRDIPIPEGFFDENWDPFTHSAKFMKKTIRVSNR